MAVLSQAATASTRAARGKVRIYRTRTGDAGPARGDPAISRGLSGLAFVASTTQGARAGPVRGSIPIYFLPVVAMLLGALVRHETIPALAIAGVALVIAGAWLSSRRER